MERRSPSRSRASRPSSTPARLSHADVFPPQLWPCGDEISHELDALVILNDLDLNAVRAQVVLGAQERSILANYDARDFIQNDGAATHGARRERRIDRALGVHRGGQASGVAQAVGFSVINRTAGLDAAVVALPDYFSIVNQDRSDRNSSFGEALARLFNRRLQKRIFFHRHDRIDLMTSRKPELNLFYPLNEFWAQSCHARWPGHPAPDFGVQRGNTPFVPGNKQGWLWTALIAQPSMVTPQLLHSVLDQVRKKSLPALARLRFESLTEGKSVQILYVGPYSAEGPTIARLNQYAQLSGKHHEIYLNTPDGTAAEKLKTIIRQPVKR